MIILLYGPDDYRREAKRREIVRQFQQKHPAAQVPTWDSEEDDIAANLKSFQENQSMFESSKLAVIKNPAVLSNQIIKEIKTLLTERKTTLLLSERAKLTKVWDFLTKPALPSGLIRESFEYLEGEPLANFIRKEAKVRGINLAESIVRFLAERYFKNTWALATELDKLSAFSNGEISLADVGRADPEMAPEFWPMVGALTSSDLKTRLTMLEKVWALNQPAAKLFNLVAYQLPQKIRACAEYDKLIKSGKLDYEEALLALLIA